MSKESSASERFHSYYQKLAARGNLREEDVPHLNKATQLEQEQTVKLSYKPVQLLGEYKSPPTNTIGDGLAQCLKRSLREAVGIDVVNLPDWVKGSDIPKICDELGLKLYTGELNIELTKGKDVIVLYKTGEDKAHAIVTNDVATFPKPEEIVGIIEIPNISDNKNLL